jgi:hypothetical protein
MMLQNLKDAEEGLSAIDLLREDLFDQSPTRVARSHSVRSNKGRPAAGHQPSVVQYYAGKRSCVGSSRGVATQ